MKQYLFIIMAAVLISTMASSCGKQGNSDTAKDSVKAAMSMAKPDSMGGGNQPVANITVTQAPNSSTGNLIGVKVTGSGPSPATNATFTLTNTAGNTAYTYQASYGDNNNPSGSGNSGSNGVSTWTQGPDSPLPQFWYPQFKATTGQPSSYTGYTSVSISGTTATFTSTAYPAANMTVTIQGGGGGPH